MIRSMSRALAACIAGALLLAGCGGGGGAKGVSGIVPGTPSNNNPIANTAAPTTFTWGATGLKQLNYLGPSKGGGLTVAVQVHMQNAAGLVQYAQSASTPGSPNYRKWLTPTQIGQEYGATLSDYQKVANYFAGYGLRVGGWPQREILTVSGTSRTIRAKRSGRRSATTRMRVRPSSLRTKRQSSHAIAPGRHGLRARGERATAFVLDSRQ